jgi:uncharacterized linocin/CFP29 family protein
MEELLRLDSPLTDDEWNRLQTAVVQVASRQLVCRRFLDIYGPLGPGVQTVKYDRYMNATPGVIDFHGDEPSGAISTETSKYVPIPMIYKDFQVNWRDLEASRRFAIPIDTSAAAGAGVFCAISEDRFVLFGDADLGVEGLLTATGSLTLGMRDWDEPGAGFADVVDATRKLHSSGHYGPYAMVLSPKRFAQLHRIYERTGVLEIRTIRELLADGVFQSELLKDDQGVIVATGFANFDLALGLDLRIAYLGEENLNLRLRALECALLRIKHPDAICVLGSSQKGKAK